MEQQTPQTQTQWDPKPQRTPTQAPGGARTKIIIGLIGAPLVTWLIIGGPFWLLALVIAVAAALALSEAGNLLFEPGQQRGKALTMICGLALFAATAFGGLGLGLIGLAVICALLMAYLMTETELERMPRILARALFGALYAGLLPALLLALKRLEQPTGVLWLFLLFMLVWLGDAGAYFAGRSLGRRPMAPRISPKKTWEGLLGGAAATLIAGLICGISTDSLSWFDGLVLGLLAALLGPLGDLVESALKRAAGVKDSGALLPGHGGILDRVDAVIFVAPFFLLFAALKFPDAFNSAAALFGSLGG